MKLGLAIAISVSALALGALLIARDGRDSGTADAAASSPSQARPGRVTADRPGPGQYASLPTRTWTLGSRYTYQFRTVGNVALDAPKPQLERGLEGRLELTVMERADDRVHAMGQFSGRDWQRPAEKVPLTGLDRPFVATFDTRGHFQMLHTHPDMPHQARKRIAAVLATLQWVAPNPDETPDATTDETAWQTEEHDPTGDYQARYQRTGENELEKTRERYLRVRSLDGLRPPDNDSDYQPDGTAALHHR